MHAKQIHLKQEPECMRPRVKYFDRHVNTISDINARADAMHTQYKKRNAISQEFRGQELQRA